MRINTASILDRISTPLTEKLHFPTVLRQRGGPCWKCRYHKQAGQNPSPNEMKQKMFKVRFGVFPLPPGSLT